MGQILYIKGVAGLKGREARGGGVRGGGRMVMSSLAAYMLKAPKQSGGTR